MPVKKSPLKRYTPLRKQSPKQAKRNRDWSALKLARITDRLNSQGFVACEGCGNRFYDLDDAREGLEAHHRVFRSHQGEYTDANLSLLCTGFEQGCHEKAHGVYP
jgi:HNH endonuclease